MDELVQAAKDWPVIIQGALGSALFWLILLAGQYAFEFVGSLYSKHSSQSRESFLVSKLCKYDAFINADSFNISATIYRSTRFLYKALMWLSLGLIFQPFVTIVGVIGFTGCLYYLFKAYELISPWNKGEAENIMEEREKVVDELRAMGKLPPKEKK